MASSYSCVVFFESEIDSRMGLHCLQKATTNTPPGHFLCRSIDSEAVPRYDPYRFILAFRALIGPPPATDPSQEENMEAMLKIREVISTQRSLQEAIGIAVTQGPEALRAEHLKAEELVAVNEAEGENQ